MNQSFYLFFRFFLHRDTVRRSARVAFVVGPILVTINQFELLRGAPLSGVGLVKMALTFCVPFCVSGYSSARAMLAEAQRKPGRAMIGPKRGLVG